MGINVECPKCKAFSKLSAKKCQRCGFKTTGKSVSRRYKVRVKDRSGKWHTRLVDGDLRQARKIEQDFFQEAESAPSKPFNKPTTTPPDDLYSPSIDYVWDRYLQYARTHKTSWRDDQQRWNRYIEPYVSGKRMDEIKPLDVEEIIGKLYAGRTKRGKPYAPATIKQVYQLFSRVYNWSIKRRAFKGENPCKFIEPPRFDNRVTSFLSPDELKAFLDLVERECANIRLRLVIQFASYTGKRKGEILQLRWSDVDLENARVTFRSETVKNRKTQILPLNEKALEVLEEAKQYQKSQLVFPCRTGKFFTSFQSCWDRFRKKHKIRFTFHQLRHTYASLLASSGKTDLYTIQKLLGHRSIQMTERYSHLMDHTLKNATGILDDTL